MLTTLSNINEISSKKENKRCVSKRVTKLIENINVYKEIHIESEIF